MLEILFEIQKHPKKPVSEIPAVVKKVFSDKLRAAFQESLWIEIGGLKHI